MSIRAPFAVREFYHLYSRGTDKRTIFLDPQDFERFLALLYLSNSSEPIRLDNIRRDQQGKTLLAYAFDMARGDALVAIGAYCLMPNHFHVLVQAQEEDGISRFMQKLLTAYTMYFNIKNDRTGSLFEGKFKSQHVTNDRYLKYLFSYIHLNPVKLIDPQWKEHGIRNVGRAKSFLKEYAYSSYIDFLGTNRTEKKILSMDAFPAYFESEALLNAHIDDWLDFKQGKTLLGAPLISR